MKTKFAKEKSQYANLIMKLLEFNWDKDSRQTLETNVKLLEAKIKADGDELIFIVTTKNTNPFKGQTAPPMEENKK